MSISFFPVRRYKDSIEHPFYQSDFWGLNFPTGNLRKSLFHPFCKSNLYWRTGRLHFHSLMEFRLIGLYGYSSKQVEVVLYYSARHGYFYSPMFLVVGLGHFRNDCSSENPRIVLRVVRKEKIPK